MVCRSKGECPVILSQKQIEEIAAAVTEDFNKFFFGTESEEVRMARATPIDQFARDYLGLQVSFARLSSDGSICGLTAYTDTEYVYFFDPCPQQNLRCSIHCASGGIDVVNEQDFL